MKLLFGYFLAICASVSAQVYPSYSSVVGHWRYTENSEITELTLSEDGTFSGFVKREAEPIWIFSGEWTLDGKNINYVYKQSSHVNGPSEFYDRDEILELSKNILVVKDLDDGRIFRCVRFTK
jgi:hypothetical protein